MGIIIRSAIERDLSILKSFEQGIIEAERPYDDTLKADTISYYDIHAMMLSSDSEVAVAESDGVCIASGYVTKKQSLDYVTHEYHAFIGFLYVDLNYRGKGIIKQILNHLFNWARNNNLPDVHLTVYPENVPAMKAYEKAGFKPHLLEMRMELDKRAE